MEQAKASNDSIEASGAGPAEAPSMAAAGSDVRAAGEPAAAAAPAGAGAASEVAAGPRHALTSGAAGKFRVVRTREQFMEVWTAFMQSRGLDTSPAIFNRATMDLFKLFKHVMKAGGYETVLVQKGWARVGRAFNPPSSMTDLSYQTKKIYVSRLLDFEKALIAGEINAHIQLDSAPSTAATPEPPASTSTPAKPRPQRREPAREQLAAAAAAAAAAGGLPAVTLAQQQQRPSSRARSRPRSRAKAPSQPAVSAGKAAKKQEATHAQPAAIAVAPPGPAAAPPSAHAAWGAEEAAGLLAAAPAPSLPRYAPSAAAMRAEAGATRPPSRHRARTPQPKPYAPQLRSTPPRVVGSPQEIVGRRIGVWWGGDTQFYFATVVGYHPESQAHEICYDDGEKEALNLRYEHWLFADGPPQPLPPPPPPPPQQQQLFQQAAPGGSVASGLSSQHVQPLAPAMERVLDGSAAEVAAGVPAPKRARTAATEQPPWGAAAGPAAFTPYQPYQQYQQQYPTEGLAELPPGLPAGGGVLSGLPLAGLPHAGQGPTHLLASGPLEATPAASAPAMPMPTTATPTVAEHHQPQALVAAGRSYRAFTASAPPAGFEIFVLMPGLGIHEISVHCWSSGLVRVSGEPRDGAAGGGEAGWWAGRSSSETIQLPARIDTQSAKAMCTAAGQLYVRVDKLH